MYESFKRRIQPFINIYHLAKASIARIYFGNPSRRLKVIGITGTDGKTTTTHLIYHILKNAGKKASIVSSVYAKIGSKEYETGLHVTTPDATYVQKLLKLSEDAGDEYFVLETTSHALDQYRVAGIDFEVSVITNITPEHLDYHKTYERYAAAKAKLLLASKTSIINHDDSSYALLSELLKKHSKHFLTYGLKNKSDYMINFQKKLKQDITDYNNYNFLAAFAVCSTLGLAENVVSSAVSTYKLPQGRLEVVFNKDFTVIIDFAHTPNSVKNVLESVRKQYLKYGGRLIHVFGSAGLRDAQKRPDMGRQSSKFADVMIITEEDYRTEDPDRIATEVASGISNLKAQNPNQINKKSRKVYTKIIDRQEAINKAISIAQKGDVVIMTGKSHEKSLCRGKTEYPWSEHEVVQKALKSL